MASENYTEAVKLECTRISPVLGLRVEMLSVKQNDGCDSLTLHYCTRNFLQVQSPSVSYSPGVCCYREMGELPGAFFPICFSLGNNNHGSPVERAEHDGSFLLLALLRHTCFNGLMPGRERCSLKMRTSFRMQNSSWPILYAFRVTSCCDVEQCIPTYWLPTKKKAIIVIMPH